MTEYCKIKKLKRDLVSFYFGGREILDTDTPNSLGLKEGDKIEVFDKDKLSPISANVNKSMGRFVCYIVKT